MAVPIGLPSRSTSYPVTPTLSVDAVQSSTTRVALIVDATSPVGMDGATVSGVVTTSAGVGADSRFVLLIAVTV